MANGDDTNGKRASWHSAPVNWWQFLTFIIPIIATLVSDRLTFEHRLTIVEDRQAFVLAKIVDLSKTDDERNKLIHQLTVDIATHRAATEHKMGTQ